jgi:hypothetical protein
MPSNNCTPELHASIGYFDYDEQRIFIDTLGGRLTIYDDDHPGMLESFKIYYCPMCGAKLNNKAEG